MNSTLMPASATRQWLKPTAFTSSMGHAVGMPWEIFRPTVLPLDTRPVDLYTKSGNFPGYAAQLVIIPEYEISIVLLAAGENSYEAVDYLLDLVSTAAILEAEAAAKAGAQATYAGTFNAESGNISDAQMVLVIDDGPGVKISNWTNLGADMLQTFAGVMFELETNDSLDARLYPTGQNDVWRVVFEDISERHNDRPVTGPACRNWMAVDNFRYGMLPVDEVRFTLENSRDGMRATALEAVGLRSAMVRVTEE